MGNIEVSVSERAESEIDRFVQEGEFLNREQAIEELLSRGLSTYNTSDSSSEEAIFTQAMEDQQDPAMRDDADDGPTF